MTCLHKVSQFLLLGIFIFTPHVAILGSRVKGIYILSFLALITLMRMRYVDHRMTLFVYLISILMGISFAFNGTVSVEAVRQVLIFTILYLSFQGIFKATPSNFDRQRDVILFIKIWLTLQSGVILASVFIDGFVNNFHDIFLLTEKAERYIGSNVLVNRYSGFAPSGFSLLSIYMALLAVLVNESTERSERSFLHYAFIIVVALSLIFVGRSGLYFFVCYLIISMSLFSLRFYLICFLLVLVFTVKFNNISGDLWNYLDFAFELFLNGFSTTSTDTLIEDEVFVPEFTFWGSGELLRVEGGANSDIGWIKLLTCFGYVGVTLYFVLFIWTFSGGLKSGFYRLPILYYIISAIVIFNFKDLYFLSSGYIQVFIIVYYMQLGQKRGVYA